MAKKEELVFCWCCGHTHTYQPCPKCGQKKWSLEHEKEALLKELKEFHQQLKKKRSKKDIKLRWKALEYSLDTVLFHTLLIGRHEAQMCDCTKNTLLEHYARLDVE